MLTKDWNLSHKQLNSLSFVSSGESKITTIAELRRKARLHNRRKSVQYHQRQAQRIKDRWEFCKIIYDMLNRIATVYNIDNALSVEDVWSVFEAAHWYADGHFHSEQAPLSIAFNVPLSFGGQLTLSNIRPCYVPGRLAGEFELHKDRLNFRPEPGIPVLMEAIA